MALAEIGDQRRVGDGLAAEHVLSRMNQTAGRSLALDRVAVDEVRHGGPLDTPGRQLDPLLAACQARLGRPVPTRAPSSAAHRDRVQADPRGDLAGVGQRQRTRQGALTGGTDAGGNNQTTERSRKSYHSTDENRPGGT